MKKIIVIGNSFGQDCTRYLYGIARADGKEIRVVNLYIGGCSLYRHYRNMLSGEAAYEFEINGIMKTGIKISLQNALLMDEWDYVVMQQCSPQSGEYEKYQPYLNELNAFVKKMCPHAKVCVNMTWSFADGCTRFNLTPFEGREDMIPKMIEAYEKAAKDIDAYMLIPCAHAMNKLYEIYGADIYRDGFHCNLGYTRFMLAGMWYQSFTGRKFKDVNFTDFDIEVTAEQIETVKNVVDEILN